MSSKCLTTSTGDSLQIENSQYSDLLSLGCCPLSTSEDEVDLPENYKEVDTHDGHEVEESQHSMSECGENLRLSEPESENIPSSIIIQTDRNRAAKIDLSKIIDPNRIMPQCWST